MATLPTSEAAGRIILGIFHQQNVRPGEMLLFNSIHSAFLNTPGMRATDFDAAIQWLSTNHFIDLRGKPRGPYFLTHAGHEAAVRPSDFVAISRDFLGRIYEVGRSDPNGIGIADTTDIAHQCGLSEAERLRTVMYLEQKGWIRFVSDGGGASAILPAGIDELSRQQRVSQESQMLKHQQPSPSSDQGKVFIVHGRNEGIKQATARFLEKLGLEPIILHEQANLGRTIIEKFESHSAVGFAVVLLTGDDIGSLKTENEKTQPRARQNVIFELGYFIGKLGRARVAALYENGVELPSDYNAVLFIPLDQAGAWRLTLAKEMKAVGLAVDLNRAV